MTVEIIEEKFRLAHQTFLTEMKNGAGGEEFRSFEHSKFVREEIAYKYDIGKTSGLLEQC